MTTRGKNTNKMQILSIIPYQRTALDIPKAKNKNQLGGWRGKIRMEGTKPGQRAQKKDTDIQKQK